VDRAKWRRGRGFRGTGALLVIVATLLMGVPSVGGMELGQGSVQPAVRTSPSVPSGTYCTVGTTPEFPAYDPVNHDIYVPNLGAGDLSILNDQCGVIKTVLFPSGAQPRAAAFNPGNNWVYVTDQHLDQVYVISGTALTLTITSPAFKAPYGVAYDPGDAVMAVADRGSNTVTFISGGIVAFTTTVGDGPTMFAYDPYFGTFLVTNYKSNSVTALDALDPALVDDLNIPVGTQPVGIAFDDADSLDYVADSGSGNVTVISGYGGLAGSVSVGKTPMGVTWDQAKLSIYVVDSGTNNVSVLRLLKVVRTIVGPSGSHLVGIAYNEASDQVFVTASGSKEVYIYDGPVGVGGPVASGTHCAAGEDPAYEAYDPVNHFVYVPDPGTNSLYILNGACHLEGSVTWSSAAQPFAAGFNPTNNMVYVTDGALNQVYVISGLLPIATITSSAFSTPAGVAFDPGNAVMAVANTGSNTVTFISGMTTDGTTTVGSEPALFAYDPYYGRFLVTNSISGNVTSLNALFPMDEADHVNIPVGLGLVPLGIAFDYADSLDYVGNSYNNNVTVIDGIGDQVGSVTVGESPMDVAWDQAKLSVWVSNYGSDSVSVIKGLSIVRTITTPSGFGVAGLAYDEATGQMFATMNLAGTVYIYT